MADRKIEHLEERINALEAQVTFQNKTIHSLSYASSLSGFLTGQSLWQMFLVEAARQANLTFPVNPFPTPPPPPPPPVKDCWGDYIAALNKAGSDIDKRLEAAAAYRACIKN